MSDRRTLRDDEVLFRVGDDGDTVFVVESGTLEVSTETTDGPLIVGQLGPGDVVGEITAVIGGARTATVTSVGDSVVRALVGSAFDDWLAANPERAAALASEARRRIDRTRVARVVAELVGRDQSELIDAFADAVDWVTLRAGELLFDQGDPSDDAYILVGGQMRVIRTVDDNVELDTRIGRGDLIGEMGVIEQAPRSASARAIRDCTLARISRQTFEDLTARYPALMLPLVRTVVTRVSDRSRAKPHAGMLAIACADPESRQMVPTIVDEIARHGTVLHLDAERVATFMQRRDIANAIDGSAAEALLNEFLHEADVAHRWVILECDDPDSDWTRRALRSADRVVVLAPARPASAVRHAIDSLCAVVRATGDYDLWIGAVNPNTRAHPSGGRAIRAEQQADRLVQLKAGDERSHRRLARLMTGTGLGLALSGGGARSFGQIGALRAMQELGIEIDAIAGTSMGSVIGAFTSLVDDTDRALAQALVEFNKKLLDYTLPLASIFSCKLISDGLEGVFGDLDIEDTMIPFVCLSTNLSTAQLVEHRDGPLARAVRASISLPGVFPPVAVDGELLVDGGVLENLPARPLRNDPGIGTVIALDVAPPGGPKARTDYGLSLSGTDILRRRVRREPAHYPALAHTVISSMLVGSSRARMDSLANDDIDLYVSLNLKGVKLLDFDALDAASERGYADAMPALSAWASETKTASDDNDG